MYDVEHKALFDGIRAGKPVNNGNYMCLSSALGIIADFRRRVTCLFSPQFPPQTGGFWFIRLKRALG